eukprot:714785-Hanusia_phi.AAC.3
MLHGPRGWYTCCEGVTFRGGWSGPRLTLSMSRLVTYRLHEEAEAQDEGRRGTSLRGTGAAGAAGAAGGRRQEAGELIIIRIGQIGRS